MSVLSSRFLVLASVASVCYANNMTGMEDMVRGNCEIVRNHDWNTPGENLDLISDVASAEKCQEICANTTDCSTFTWGHADANESGVALSCWLKKPSNETVVADKLTPYAEVDSGACPVEEAAAPEPAGPSFPIWGWILVVLGVLGVIGGIAAYMMMGKKETKPKKKKRATATPPAPPAPPAETPTVLVAPPIYVAPPVYTAVPTVVEAPVVTYAASEAPIVYAAPTSYVTSEAPVVYAAPTGSVSVPVAVPATSSFVATAQPVTYITAPAGGLA